MEGLGQAVEQIRNLAIESRRAQIVKAPDFEKSGTYFIALPDGKIERKMAEPPFNNMRLDTPADLRAFVEKYADPAEAAVFYDDEKIVMSYNIEDRRDQAICPLIKSQPFMWLINNGGKDFTQIEFIRALRIVFRGCINDSGVLIGLLKKARFENGSVITTNLGHGNTSMGKQINQEIGAETPIPEEITLNVNVYSNYRNPVTVACAIELMPGTATFRLTPYPNELDNALTQTLNSIQEMFAVKDLPPVFRGAPAFR